MQDMAASAEKAARFLKLIAHPHRLLILCTLLEGERNVTELTKIVGISQTSMSNHLARLRSEDVVDFTREQRTLTYRLSTANAEPIIAALYKIYCSGPEAETDK
ncbi:winged helix-turn-helix transcriptional regulator [Advenella sp. WQ 585]|uniref:Winged helix-turn-helix transcriptional regulator n=1 Tax=Advenella mandrilli TaxID=2800330 RepID=A0ABS1E8R2_9BURK|nr:metalloregulator ArsR/SmtB family transcription factor [Advenella mandrilli]MBK1780061.1 winged helix-turn-helix transcriptional regulator [Advenella mandrilli]